MASDVIGEALGNYRIIEKIGDGGMGIVYLARHSFMDTPVAIKVLHRHHLDDAETKARFFNEARAAMQVHHPGIVRIFDCGTHQDGTAFLIMEYLEGEDLSKRIRGGRRLPVSASILIGRQVVQALEAAHAQGIVHRDLKPDNLFMTPDPEVPGGERVKILDFGIAKLLDDSLRSLHKTQTGAVMGTPTYMSPEQCKGTGVVDHRADLYSLGCILFRLMCGRVVFRAKGYGELIAAHIHVPPPSPSSIEPTIPPLFEDIILRLLAKEPRDRYQSATELLEAIDDAVADTHLGLPDPDAEEDDEPQARRRATTGEETQLFTPSDSEGHSGQGSGDWIQPFTPGDLDESVRNVELEPTSMIDILRPRSVPRAQTPAARTSTPLRRAAVHETAAPMRASEVHELSPEELVEEDLTDHLQDEQEEPEEIGDMDGMEEPDRAASSAKLRAATVDGMGQPDRAASSAKLRAAMGKVSEVAIDELRAGPPWLLIALLALLAVGAASFVVLFYGDTTRIDDPLTTASPGDHVPGQKVTLRIESTPPGAQVVRENDGAKLGTTPYQITLAPARGELVVMLELTGYETRVVHLPMDRSSTERVALVPSAPAPP